LTPCRSETPENIETEVGENRASHPVLGLTLAGGGSSAMKGCYWCKILPNYWLTFRQIKLAAAEMHSNISEDV